MSHSLRTFLSDTESLDRRAASTVGRLACRLLTLGVGQGRRKPTSILASFVFCLALIFNSSGGTFAQEGFGRKDEASVGLIGVSKSQNFIVHCDPGQFLVGVSHWDVVNTSIPSARGMTGKVDLSCAPITTDGTTVSLGATETVAGASYSGIGNRRDAICPAGQVAFLFYGRDRISNDGGARWASQVGIACRPVILMAGDWLQLDASVSVNRQDAGVIENNGAHSSKGPFCDTYDILAGYERQYGGRGYDGIKARCANFSQARHSAHLTFSNFAWDQTIGGAGWLVNLTHNSTSMAGGVGKLPYSAVPDNDTSEFQEPHELYVYDGGDYGATAGQRPSGVAPETYVELGTCAEGRSLALRQDDTCSLTIAGLPDIGVTASPASAVFTGYDEPQTLTMTATNFGPGATGADGYTMVATLPSGWSVNGALPANCAASGQLVTCALDPSPLSGSGSPGSAGGTISFDIPVSVSYPTPGGVQSFTVALGRSTPDNDGNPANVDYDNSNDTVVGSFDFQPSPASLAEPDKTVVDANGNGVAEPGEQLTYTITLTNNGSTDATNVSISDDLDPNTTYQTSDNAGSHSGGSPGGTVSWSNKTVPAKVGSTPGTLVLTTVVTVVDPLPPGGRISNAAYETGSTPPDCSTNPTPSSCAVLSAAASLVVETVGVLNDANGNGFADAGETIGYTYTVSNTGGLDISGITIDDPNLSVSGGPISLAANASDSSAFSATYTLTVADIDAGRFETQATVRGTASDGSNVTDLSDDPSDPTNTDLEGDGEPDDPNVFTFAHSPSYDFVKEAVHDDANGNGFADAGEVINYTFTVENTGNVTLSDVAVTDTKATISGSPIATLAPGEIDTSSVTGVYTITQADVDAGTVDNVAAATAKDPGGNDVERQSRPPSGSPGDATSQPMAQNGDYDFVKEAAHVDANGNNLIDAGEIINYTFTVENTGNVTLTDIEVTDSRATVSGSPLAGPLAPGAVDATSVTGTYTVVQADIDAGNLDNVAASTATLPDGSEIAKQSRPVDGVEGDPTAPPGGVDTVSDYDFVKEAVHDDANGNGFADAGEVINYTFTVENTGNVTLSDVAVTDTKATISGSPIATLAPGEIDTSVTGIHTITQDDIDAGSFSNSATAVGKNPKGEDVPKEARPSDGSPGDPTVITFEANPSIEVDLSDEWIDMNANGYPDPGEPVVYSFVVRNTGNVTLEDVTITELDEEAMDGKTPEGSVPVSGGAIAHLAPGSEDNSLPAASYPLKPSDIDAGGLVATADVAGHTRAGVDVIDDSDDPGEMANIDMEGDGEPDDPTRTLLPHHAALGLEKMGAFQGATGRLAQPGDTILYTLTATNEGNVTISDVKPVDSGPRFGGRQGSGTLSSFSPSSVDLVAGTSETFTATYTVTQGDIDAAQGIEDGIQNTATISGTEPRGQAVTSPEAEASVDLPGYAINKVTPLAEVRRGGRVPYTISVKMLGSLEARPVNIVDMTPPGLTYVRGSAQLDGSSVTPKIEGRKLTFENVTLSPDTPILIDLELAVTSAAKPGEYTNQAWVEDLLGERISRNATATVEVVVEAVFDCGDILGKVFDDKNRNGYQDAGEPGLPGVRVATVKGLLLTADDNGRFHVACADLPDQRIGTNYIMKLDPRSLPSGYRLTTENPRVVRLTAGKASEFQFGASIGRVVRLDLTDAAFVQGAQQLRPEWETQIAQMIALLDKEPSVLRLVYAEGGEGKRLAKKRINALRKLIAREWRVVGGRYRLEIETRLGTEAVSGSDRVKALE